MYTHIFVGLCICLCTCVCIYICTYMRTWLWVITNHPGLAFNGMFTRVVGLHPQPYVYIYIFMYNIYIYMIPQSCSTMFNCGASCQSMVPHVPCIACLRFFYGLNSQPTGLNLAQNATNSQASNLVNWETGAWSAGNLPEGFPPAVPLIQNEHRFNSSEESYWT